MVDYLEDVDRFDPIEKLIRREQIVRDWSELIPLGIITKQILWSDFDQAKTEAVLVILDNIDKKFGWWNYAQFFDISFESTSYNFEILCNWKFSITNWGFVCGAQMYSVTNS